MRHYPDINAKHFASERRNGKEGRKQSKVYVADSNLRRDFCGLGEGQGGRVARRVTGE